MTCSFLFESSTFQMWWWYTNFF